MKRYSTFLIACLFLTAGLSTLPAEARTRAAYCPVVYPLVTAFPLMLGIGY
jgi:hypothetical protein